MGIDEWGRAVTMVTGFAFVVATVVALVMRRRRMAAYMIVTAYALLWPINLWFWQFGLTRHVTVSPPNPFYIWNDAIVQIGLCGIVPLIVSCFYRFRPVVTAVLLLYVFSLLLQLFSYMYWAYGTTSNFSVSLSHLDSLYFALGTLTTAGTGNISAISETARGLQTLQMGLDLVFVGIVVALVVARYSTLLTRSQPGLPREGATAAKPASVPDRSDPPRHASKPNHPPDERKEARAGGEESLGTRSD